LPLVDTGRLDLVTSRGLYAAWTTDLPPPKVESRYPLLHWPLVWARIQLQLDLLERDFLFSLIHNILPTPARRHRLGVDPSPACARCPAAVADTIHVFTACPLVNAAWEYLCFRASMAAGAVLGGECLLFLAWDASEVDLVIVSAVSAYVRLVWDTREELAPLNPALLRRKAAEAAAAATGPRFRHLFA